MRYRDSHLISAVVPPAGDRHPRCGHNMLMRLSALLIITLLVALPCHAAQSGATDNAAAAEQPVTPADPADAGPVPAGDGDQGIIYNHKLGKNGYLVPFPEEQRARAQNSMMLSRVRHAASSMRDMGMYALSGFISLAGFALAGIITAIVVGIRRDGRLFSPED